MNDFLQNLRNGQAEKQRTGKTRKSYDNSYRYSNPRFHSYPGHQRTPVSQSLKRQAVPSSGNQIPNEETNYDLLAEAIDNLSMHVEAIAKNQEFLIIAQDRAADMLERQAVAIENIVKYLHSRSGQTPDEEIEIDIKPIAHPVTEKNEIISKKPVRSKPAKKESMPLKATKVLKRNKGTKTVDVIPVPDSSETKLMSREAVMDIINTMRANGATFDEVAKRLIELEQPTFSGRGEWHAQTIHRLCNRKKK